MRVIATSPTLSRSQSCRADGDPSPSPLHIPSRHRERLRAVAAAEQRHHPQLGLAERRGKASQLVRKLTAMSPDGIGLSSITVADLQHGVMKSRSPEQNQAALDQFLLPFDILPFDLPAAVAYGAIRDDLERQGMSIGAFDMLIAAQALSLGAVVVTNNVRELSRVAGLVGEDWTAG